MQKNTLMSDKTILIFGEGAIVYGLVIENLNSVSNTLSIYLVCENKNFPSSLKQKNVEFLPKENKQKILECFKKSELIFVVCDYNHLKKLSNEIAFYQNEFKCLKKHVFPKVILVCNGLNVKEIFCNQAIQQHGVDLFNHVISSLPDRICLINKEKNQIFFEPFCNWSVQKEDFQKVRYPFFNPVDYLDDEEELKLIFFNAPHALCAWLGGLLGYEKMCLAIQDERILKFLKLLFQEILFLIMQIYPQRKEEFLKREASFFCRVLSCDFDTCQRVARDPIRKIGKGFGLYRLKEIAFQKGVDDQIPIIDYSLAIALIYWENFKKTGDGFRFLLKLKKDYKFDLLISEKIWMNVFDFLKKNPINPAFQNLKLKKNKKKINFFYSKNSQYKVVQELEKIHIGLNQETGHLYYKSEFLPLKIIPHLLFIRHGQTYGNAGLVNENAEINFEAKENKNNRIFQGNVDASCNQLTLKGKNQAAQTAFFLNQFFLKRKTSPDFVFYSPLTRSKETCECFIQQYFPYFLPQPLDLIKEMDFGYLENRRVCDLPKEDPAHTFYLNQNSLFKVSGFSNDGLLHYAESFAELLLRIKVFICFLNTLQAKYVVVFSHSMVWSAIKILIGRGDLIPGSHFLCFDAHQDPVKFGCGIHPGQGFLVTDQEIAPLDS